MWALFSHKHQVGQETVYRKKKQKNIQKERHNQQLLHPLEFSWKAPASHIFRKGQSTMPQSKGRVCTKVTPQFSTSRKQWPFLRAAQGGKYYLVDKTKECYHLLFSPSLYLNCRIDLTSPHHEKNKTKIITIYRENKFLSHSLYNWAYTLFTARSLIQKKKNITQLQKQISITRLPFSENKPLQKQWLQGWRQSVVRLSRSVHSLSK